MVDANKFAQALFKGSVEEVKSAILALLKQR